MAPKDLIRNVFHNIYRQKSMDLRDDLKTRKNEKAHSRSLSRRQSAPLLSTSTQTVEYADADAEEPLAGIKEGAEEDVSSVTDATLDGLEEGEEVSMTEFDIYPESHAPGAHRQVYHEAVSMTTSHLDTIDTTLTLLEAFEGMSPHLEGLRNEMQAKKALCKQTLKTLKMMSVTE